MKNNPGKEAAMGKKEEPRRRWLLPVALVVTFLAFLPVFQNDYVNWDDQYNIYNNPLLEDVSAKTLVEVFTLKQTEQIGNYNPLPIATFALEKWVTGEAFNPVLSHTINLILHLAVVFLVFQLVLLMGAGYWGAALAALLFGIHPMHVESVAWASERKDVLYAVFYFWALLLYVKKIVESGGNIHRYWSWGMLILFILALFSKVQAVTLPLVMLAFDTWFGRKTSWKLILEKWPFLLLALVFGLLNIITLRQAGVITAFPDGAQLIENIGLAAYVVGVYLFKLVWPHPLSPVYLRPIPVPVIGWILLIVIIVVSIWVIREWIRNRHRVMVFILIFFGGNIVFLLQILQAGEAFAADRFTYMAYFAFFAVAGNLLKSYFSDAPRRKIIVPSVVIVLGIFFVLTFRQVKIWQNGETLWTRAIQVTGEKQAEPFLSRADYRAQKEDLHGSLDDISSAIRIHPNLAWNYTTRGRLYMKVAAKATEEGQALEYLGKAAADFTKGLSLPDLPAGAVEELHIQRGITLLRMREYDKSLIDFELGLSKGHTPESLDSWLEMAAAAYYAGKYDRALFAVNEFIRFHPDNVVALGQRGVFLRLTKQYDAALADFNRVLALRPKYYAMHQEKALVYLALGERQQAVEYALLAQQNGVELDSSLVLVINKKAAQH